MKTLREIKTQLVEAHKSEDWETAKMLSQEKERLKRQQRPRCGICNVPLARKPFGKVQPENCIMHHMMKRFYSVVLTCLIVLLALSIKAQSVQIAFAWNNPGAQYSNLVYKLYYTTNVTIPTNQWSFLLLTNVVSLPNNTLASTNSFPYGNWFFAMTWTNSMWKQESFFSNTVVPDRLPPINQAFNLILQPTP